MSIQRKITYLLLLIFAISVWEHVATETESLYKPTYFLDQVTETIRPWFRYFGVLFAVMASFMEKFKLFVEKILRWMKIENYFKTLGRLFGSSYNLAMSWAWFIFGYLDYVTPLAEFSMNLTIFGTLVIIGLVGFLFYRYVWSSPRFGWFKHWVGRYLRYMFPVLCVLTVCALVAVGVYYTQQPVTDTYNFGTLFNTTYVSSFFVSN